MNNRIRVLQGGRGRTQGGIVAKNRTIKTVEANGLSFIIQSVSPTWYLEQNDKCGMTGGGNRNTPKYMDTIFRNCVIKPAEVSDKGMKYFDRGWDVKTAIELLKAIERFLATEADVNDARNRARHNKDYWCFIFAGNRLTYSEIKAMDIADYREVAEARLLWEAEWRAEASRE